MEPISRLAVVILHYGRVDLTQRLHEQLLESDPEHAAQMFVLDNHAPEPYPGAWLRTEANLYWPGALERSLETLSGQGFSHVWFLNNDLYFGSDRPHISKAWTRMQRISRQTGTVGIYSPAAASNPYHRQMVRRSDAQYRRVALVDGIAPLIAVSCWQALGGLDHAENPYGYGVDVWFSLCAHRAGWPVVVDHQVWVKHVYHSTARSIPNFLRQAALAEAAYLEKRLGAGYKQDMECAQRDFVDEMHL